MGFIGFLSRTFLYGLSNPEIHGLDSFLATIDARQEVGRRQRGLITGIWQDALLILCRLAV